MKTKTFLRCHCIFGLVLLLLPAVVQAQFTFTTNNDAITITGYNGPGGAVVIPNTINGYSVTGIGEAAFADCTNLTSIAITNSVSFSIGEEAFADCTSLTNITIPFNVTGIGEAAFVGCVSLTNISVNVNNQSFSSINGVLFDRQQDTLIAYPDGRTTTNGAYVIPGSVRSIGQYAFASCSTLTSVVLTNLTIGEFAFSQCTVLTSVTIQNNVTNIGVAAFTFCTSLSDVVVAGSVTNIGGLAFAFCTNLTSAYFQSNAPPDVGTAFYGDPDAVVYYLPGTTGWGATFGDATTEETTPPSDFGYETYDGSIDLTRYNGPGGGVVIPAFINGYPVTSIVSAPPGNDVFDSNVTSVTIPNTVTNIGESAFANCESLTYVTIPNSVTSIGQYAFQECRSLSSVTIPGSVTSIGGEAFEYCIGLRTVTIDNGVTSIGGSAFFLCSSLTSITIPNSVNSIGQEAFEYCTSLTRITIPGSVTNIGEGAFSECTSLTNITIPNSVNSIAANVFYYCTNLTTVTIPNGVTSIGYAAFKGCGLTSITIPNSVTNIGDDAFESCTKLTSAYFQGNAPPDDGTVFNSDPDAVVYYLPGTTGWSASFGDVPTELWNPQASALATTRGQFGFNITGPTNATIVVEACTNLANPVWLPVSTNALSASGASSFSDPQWANYPNRYYRFSAP